VVALDENGPGLSTMELADRCRGWLELGGPVALLIGGPDGLAPACFERAQARWSLSPLTLPHGLVRVVVAEALYRAFSLLQGHPYHRA
jgi:23S rRNA (pseudouridine1915-N3)-methyltransferase